MTYTVPCPICRLSIPFSARSPEDAHRAANHIATCPHCGHLIHKYFKNCEIQQEVEK